MFANCPKNGTDSLFRSAHRASDRRFSETKKVSVPVFRPKAALALLRRGLFLMTAALIAQETTFVVDTKLVVVNVTVKDKSGRPVTNLKQENFQILEDGVPQKISVF